MNKTASVDADNYTADDILHFEYPLSIWKRPSMYLGERGGQQSVGIRELTDNATQEGLRGFADRVRVVFNEDGSIIVQDNGRGLPVDMNKKSHENGIILTMATLHAGANFKSDVKAGQAGAGLNGVGASVTNALSKRFDVLVYRNGKTHSLSFQNGYAGHFTGDGPDADFTKSDDIVVTKDNRPASEKKSWKTGTWIRLWYNKERFPEDEHVDRDDLIERLRGVSYIIPKLHIDIQDRMRVNEDGSPYEYSFYSEYGIPEFVENTAPDELLPESNTNGSEFEKKGIYSISVEGHYQEHTTDEHGKAIIADRTVTADLAMRWGIGYEKTLKSYVNTIQTHNGGIHEEAFENSLTRSVVKKMDSMRSVLTKKDETPISDDVLSGATVILSVNVPEPQFVGQQKDKLSGPEVKKALTTALSKGLSDLFDSNKSLPAFRAIFDKIKTTANDRRSADEAKLLKRQSHRVTSASLPAKLSDCDMVGSSESELLICEGDSAAGTIVKARDATYQAVIPIRGKILNCLKASMRQILKNTEIADIAKALGAGMGDTFDSDKLRYGRVIFAADADVDGLQIDNLLYTVFNRLFHDMIVEGRVFQAVSPLYEIRSGSGKNQSTFYAIDGDERDKITKRLDAQKKTYKVDRDKGLGEMEPDDFWNAVLDPEQRTLKRITLDDVAQAEEALTLTMDDSSDEKKDFMGDNFQVAIDTGLIEGFGD
jgi:DNA gyrase subunit B